MARRSVSVVSPLRDWSSLSSGSWGRRAAGSSRPCGITSAAAEMTGGRAISSSSLVQFRETFVQAAFQVAGAGLGGFRLHLQGPARRLRVEQLGVAHVPVVDLAGQALLHQAADLGDAGGDQVAGSGQFFGHAFGDGPVERDGLHARGTARVRPGGESATVRSDIIQGFVVQVPRLARGAHPVGPWASTSTKPNFLVTVRAGSWPSVISWVTATSSRGSVAGVVPVGEHRALLEQRAVPLDDQVGHRVEQRVPGGQQVRARLALGAGQLLVERHPLVLLSTGAARGRSGGPGRGCRRGRAGSRSGRLALGQAAAE